MDKNMTAVRKIKFDTGHRVVGQGGKCETLHGHEYKMFVHARASKLNTIGMVIDFSEIKRLCGGWLDDEWDHNMIIWKDDPNKPLIEQCVGKKAPFISDFNPTAENMADFFLNVVCPGLFNGSGIEIYKIVLWETENCYVEATL